MSTLSERLTRVYKALASQREIVIAQNPNSQRIIELVEKQVEGVWREMVTMAKLDERTAELAILALVNRSALTDAEYDYLYEYVRHFADGFRPARRTQN